MAGFDLPLEAAISNNYSWVEASRNSADSSEGIRAFVEKRARGGVVRTRHLCGEGKRA